MKTRFLATAAVVLLAQGAQASSGTINFTGSITDNTCTVGNTSLSVTLPPLTVSALNGGSASGGKTAGDTTFTIDLSSCSFASGNATAYFEFGANTDAANNGTLKNTSSGPGAATGVNIQLLNDNGLGTVIDVSKTSGNQGVVTAPIAANKGTAKFIARYYATGSTVTSGPVTSSVTYSMVYN